MEDKKEKIQKLLNLATSDNEHEAALALAKATELMNKWNLDKGSVLGTNIEKVERELPFYKWTSENQVLVNLLTRLCDGFCLYVNGNKKANKFAKILISGRPRDLENFGYLYDFINTKLWSESQKYKLKIRKSGQDKNTTELKSFRIGFLKKIEEKLIASKHEFFTVNKALVSIDSETKRKEAEDFLRGSIKKIKEQVQRISTINKHLEAGKNVADDIDLNVAVNGGKSISKIGYKNKI